MYKKRPTILFLWDLFSSEAVIQALAGTQSELGQPITSQGHRWEKYHPTFFPVWQQILQQFSHTNGPFVSCWSIWVNGNYGRVFPLKPRGRTVCTCRWKIFIVRAIKIHGFCRKNELPLYWYLIFIHIKNFCIHFLPYQKLTLYMKPSSEVADICRRQFFYVCSTLYMS